MNLKPPPKTGDKEFDQWVTDLYEFLKYPIFQMVTLKPREDMDTPETGTIYYDSDVDKVKVYTSASAWEDLN